MKRISKMKSILGISLLVGSVVSSVNIGTAIDFVNRGSETVLVETKPQVILEGNSSNAQTGIYVSSNNMGRDSSDYTPSQEKNEDDETNKSSKLNTNQEASQAPNQVSKTSRLEKIGRFVGTVLGAPSALSAGIAVGTSCGIVGTVKDMWKDKVEKRDYRDYAGRLHTDSHVVEGDKFGAGALALFSTAAGVGITVGMIWGFRKIGAWFGRSINNIIYNEGD